jgi:hypothetical protein
MKETDLFGEPGSVFTEVAIFEIIRRPELSSQESSSYFVQDDIISCPNLNCPEGLQVSSTQPNPASVDSDAETHPTGYKRR